MINTLFRRAAVAAVLGLGLAATSVGLTEQAQATIAEPRVSVALMQTKVSEPGGLGVKVHLAVCATHVHAVAFDQTTGALTWSSVVRAAGRKDTLVFRFTTRDQAGREVIADVYGRPCGTGPGAVAFDPNSGSFPSFEVTRG